MVKKTDYVSIFNIVRHFFAQESRTFLYKNFKSIFLNTKDYKRWKMHRELCQDERYLRKRLAKRRLALRASQHPDWSTLAKMPIEELFEAIRQAMLPARKQVIIAFGHTNYCKVIGGVQLCIGIEQAEFSSMGADYIYAYPAISSVLMPDDSYAATNVLGVIVNGKELGCCQAGDLTKVIAQIMIPQQFTITLVLHALLGHCLKSILDLKDQLDIGDVFFWIHDFYYLCPCAHLLFNDQTFCDAPTITSPECTTCLYGEYRQSHLTQLRRLFETYSITAIAPSRFALDYWNLKAGLPTKRTLVQNHIRLGQQRVLPKPVTAPLQIGFLGALVQHKGWNTFVNLAENLSGDKRYQFHAFTQTDPCHPNIGWCKVEVSHTAVNAMVDALLARNIDIMVLWSQTPETYSFTLYEAMTAGGFIVTSEISGNIADTVQEARQGIVLGTNNELLSLFQSGEISEFYETFRNQDMHSQIIDYSNLTADILNDSA